MTTKQTAEAAFLVARANNDTETMNRIRRWTYAYVVGGPKFKYREQNEDWAAIKALA